MWSRWTTTVCAKAVFQGAFILAKAKDDPQAATDSIAHLRRYFELLFYAALLGAPVARARR
jgi:hypothetical protein